MNLIKSLLYIFLFQLAFTNLSLADPKPVNEYVNNLVLEFQRTRGIQKEVLFYKSMPELMQYREQVEGIELLTSTYHMRFSSEGAAINFRQALLRLKELEKMEAKSALPIIDEILIGLFRLATSNPMQPEDWKKLGQVLERINEVGGAWDEYMKEKYGTTNTKMLSFLDNLLKYAKATNTLDDLRKTGEVNVKDFMDNIVGLVPNSVSISLNGPASVFFTDLLEYNQKMWKEPTDALNIIADGIESGQIDHARLAQVTERINKLAKEGPWSVKSGLDFFQKILEGLPVVGKLFKAIKGVWQYSVCRPINCDCAALVDWGILAGEYIKECKNHEKSIKDSCNKTGKIEGACHITASGPNAYPR
jgi:hypothetical protein